ncbi:MAG: 16S rRNA (guanine(527)-N(7))-methyltransferase RsmG [Acutalibacteraceae bacterium]
MELLLNYAKDYGINLDEKAPERFKIYYNFLVEYNKHTNLTSITEKKDVIIKHFLDSIIVSKFLELTPGSRLIDVGTGAGFPGVPLKIANPEIDLTLLDSLNKRIIFLNKLVEKLGLTSEIFHNRAEECGKNKKFREKFNIVTSRAVAKLTVLSEYCLPLLKVGGYFVSLKGSNVENELEESKKSIEVLGGKIERVEKFDLPEEKGGRAIVVIKKISSTPGKYPRSNANISKFPII